MLPDYFRQVDDIKVRRYLAALLHRPTQLEWAAPPAAGVEMRRGRRVHVGISNGFFAFRTVVQAVILSSHMARTTER